MKPPAAPATPKPDAERTLAACLATGLGAEPMAFLSARMSPAEYLEVLIEREMFPDAIKFQAAAFSVREAIWWACLCMRWAAGEPPFPLLDTALRIAVRWVLSPTESNRQQAERSAKGDLPRDYLLRAIGNTGGSLSPPQFPPIAPDPRLVPRCLAGALLLMATRGEPIDIQPKMRQFLAIAIKLREGKIPFPAVTPQPGTHR